MSAETDATTEELIKRINIFFPVKLRPEYVAMFGSLRDEIERLKETCEKLTDTLATRAASETELIREALAEADSNEVQRKVDQELLRYHSHRVWRAKQEEIDRLNARVAELEEFVSACRYAGPGGLERLKEEAAKLCAGRKAAKQ